MKNRTRLAQGIQAVRDPRALLQLDTVCTLVGFSKATIYKLVKNGEFPAPVKIGYSSRWPSADVQAWLATHGGSGGDGDRPPALVSLEMPELLKLLSEELGRMARQVEELSAKLESQAGSIDVLHSRLSRVGEALVARDRQGSSSKLMASV